MGAELLIFRCPQTGYKVQTYFPKRERNEPETPYQSFNCAACTRVHFVDTRTGKTLGQGN
jgi:hypothetical protein